MIRASLLAVLLASSAAVAQKAATLTQIAWLRTHHPGYKFKDNDLESRGGRKLETITIETGGRTLPVCFDITESFETGKLR